jgi:hypothetical protein
VSRPKRVEQLRNTGIINSTTGSHLVGYFYEMYIKMHRSVNIKITSFFMKSCLCFAVHYIIHYSQTSVSQEHQLDNLIMADINTNIFVFINILKPSNYFTYYHNSHLKILHVAHIVYAFCMAFRTNSNFYLVHH